MKTLSQKSLQKNVMKEGEIPPHTAPRSETYADDTKKTKEHDIYHWLDTNEKKQNMRDHWMKI